MEYWCHHQRKRVNCGPGVIGSCQDRLSPVCIHHLELWLRHAKTHSLLYSYVQMVCPPYGLTYHRLTITYITNQASSLSIQRQGKTAQATKATIITHTRRSLLSSIFLSCALLIRRETAGQQGPIGSDTRHRINLNQSKSIIGRV